MLPYPPTCHYLPTAEQLTTLPYEKYSPLHEIVDITALTDALEAPLVRIVFYVSPTVTTSDALIDPVIIDIQTDALGEDRLRGLIAFVQEAHYLHHNPIAHRVAEAYARSVFADNGHGIEEYRAWLERRQAVEITPARYWTRRSTPDIESISLDAYGRIQLNFGT